MIRADAPGRFRIIDISQPVSSATACFPGDVPFSRALTLEHATSGVINLSALTMSPHVGTHADAPGHVRGGMSDLSALAAAMPLAPFVGPAVVVDASPWTDRIPLERVRAALDGFSPPLERVLFRTQTRLRPEVFEEAYASFSVELVEDLAARGVVLAGLDTPSVDPVDSKDLPAHHTLVARGLHWLENLDLTDAPPGRYFLAALPLRLVECEASPVRAVLLAER